jgi:acetoin utilization deacetylase AcuC-like enzyme
MVAMPTGLVYHPQFLEHKTGANHPESPDRLLSIHKRLSKTSYYSQLINLETRQAVIEELSLVHSPEYIQRFLQTTSTQKKGFFDGDTPFSEGTREASLLSAGAGLVLSDALLAGRITNGFAMVRPPGHHAVHKNAMGFCMFNNIAFTARYLQKKGLKKILILDWDVHHGNGTEEAFYSDPSVYFLSIHQYPFYPGTGSHRDTGEGAGKGFNLNMPVPRGSTDSDYLRLFEKLILREVEQFDPECILVSAGFDAHKMDPLGEIELSTGAFEKFTKIMKKAADEHCSGRLLSFLEGGYNLEALAESVDAHLSVLVG